MKTLLAFLILMGIGGYYIHKTREENAQLKAQLNAALELLPEDERARLFAAKPLIEEKIPSAPAKRAVVHKRILCPQCNGEGAIMIRRAVNGSVTDVKTMCALCMGAGKREFDMPSQAEICPDCGGMGKRMVYGSNASRPLSPRGDLNFDGRSRLDGFSNQAPTTSSCPRCLGKGFIQRPGLAK